MAWTQTRIKEMRKRRKEQGLCIMCGNTRNADGTTTFCRPCANKQKVKAAKHRSRVMPQRKADDLCMTCGREKGENGTTRVCRSCANKACVISKRLRLKRQNPVYTYIVGNGYCGICDKPVDKDVCEKCYFSRMAQRHLNSSKRWRELQSLFKSQDGKCAYTGIPLTIGIDASIDHVLPSSRFPECQYDINNFEWVCDYINIMKKDMTKEEFLELIKVIGLNLNLIEEQSPWAESLKQD
jgi:hypothetical protein